MWFSSPLAAPRGLSASLPAPIWLPHPLFGICKLPALVATSRLSFVVVCLHSTVLSYCQECRSLWVGLKVAVPSSPPAPYLGHALCTHLHSQLGILFHLTAPVQDCHLLPVTFACSTSWALSIHSFSSHCEPVLPRANPPKGESGPSRPFLAKFCPLVHIVDCWPVQNRAAEVRGLLHVICCGWDASSLLRSGHSCWANASAGTTISQSPVKGASGETSHRNCPVRGSEWPNSKP